MPASIVRGRSVVVRIKARDNVGVTRVRFSTQAGRWGTWRTFGRGAHRVMVPGGLGWKGVLMQVGDDAGQVSRPWYQTILAAPARSAWGRGTTGADRLRFGAGSQHIDLSAFDNKRDFVSCGRGFDTVLLQPEDVAGRDCEVVTRVALPASD
jgi:hypothetical protein